MSSSFLNARLPLLCLIGALCILQFTAGMPNLLRDDEMEIDLSHLGEKIYGKPDEANGETLRSFSHDNNTVNPEELGNYAEGDILFVKSDARNGVKSPSKRWPNGRVPYKIAGHFTQKDLALINVAMQEYHDRTCIRFVPHAGERNYIRITSADTGCWSSVGMQGGEQDVNLQTPGCMTQVGTCIHELMHALGFMHEQNREDRDGSVVINWNNVRPATVDNFAKANAGTTDAMNVGYDFDSVLHYSPHAFSTNGQPTIVSKQGPKPNMGQRRGFSVGDVQKLNAMYCGGGGASAASNQVYSQNQQLGSSAPAGNFWSQFANVFGFKSPKA